MDSLSYLTDVAADDRLLVVGLCGIIVVVVTTKERGSQLDVSTKRPF